jgi:hypothetical protein
MEIRVRMYRQGIGDCFLLSFGEADAARHMLIDCGVLTGTKGGAERVIAVATDIRDTTNGHIDVLVVTHEHWDHVSGFVQANEVFKECTIEEIWLAWTEDDSNEMARGLKGHREQARQALTGVYQRLVASQSLSLRASARVVESLSLFEGEPLGAKGRSTTAAAMKWVRDHEHAHIRHFRPGIEPVSTPRIPGLRAFVLGPPEDWKSIRREKPSKRTPEVYELGARVSSGFLAALGATRQGEHPRSPFDTSFECASQTQTAAESDCDKFYRDRYLAKDTWRQIESDWLGSGEGLALQLDSDTNNTSLALALEDTDTGRILLFPGDAQVGNWLSWEMHEWRVRNPEAGRASRTIRVDDLLARTVLYKVAHHASHNATLRERGLELMTSPDLVALIPVDAERAEALEWAMPFQPLMTRLLEKTRGRVIRSDVGAPSAKPEGVSARAWKEFQARLRTEDLYIEYRL